MNEKPKRPNRIAPLDLTPQLKEMLQEMVDSTGRRRAEIIREAISEKYAAWKERNKK